MGKLFGTDGIRGIVGENLTVELAFHTGQAIAAVLKPSALKSSGHGRAVSGSHVHGT